MKKKKLFAQIFPTYLVLIAFVVIFFAVYEQNVLKEYYSSEIRSDLTARAELIREHIQHLDLRQGSRLDSVTKELSRYAQARITLIQSNGIVLSDSHEDYHVMDNHSERPEVKIAFLDSIGQSTRYSNTLKKELIYLAVPFKRQGEIVAAVRVAYSMVTFRQSMNLLQRRVLMGAIFVLLLGALFSYFISRRIVKPLVDIKRGAERFATGAFEPPLSERGSSEISALSTALNKMAREINNRIQTISLQRSEQEAMFKSMKEGVLAVGADERIIRINDAAIEFFGIELSEPEKQSVQTVIQHREVVDFILDSLKENDQLCRDIFIKNRAESILRLTSAPLQIDTDNTGGTLILLNDITRFKKLDKVRQDFVANVSHELKTPLTSIKGFIETLEDGALDDRETATKFLKIIRKHTESI